LLAFSFLPVCLSLSLLLAPPQGEKLPGPGDPLPPFDLRKAGDVNATLGKEQQSVLVVTGGFELLWGDLKLTGDRFTYDAKKEHLEAFGHVTVQRGDETLHGETLTLDGIAGLLDLQKASADSPPFFFMGDRIQRTPTSIIAQRGILSLKAGGGGEVRLRAAEIRLLSSGRLILYNTTLYFYNKPILRLRHLSIPVDAEQQYAGNEGHSAPSPLTIRHSHISGSTFGVATLWTPFAHFSGTLVGEASSLQGLQYAVTLGHSFLGGAPGGTIRRLNSAPGGRGTKNQETAPTTPLRQLLTARIPPAPRDAVLDFVDILPMTDPFTRPTRSMGRSVFLETALMGNREFSGSRFGPLMLSRLPEVTLSGSLPLSHPADVNDNATARHALRSPRFYLSGDTGGGIYREVRLNQDRFVVDERRTSSGMGLGFNPLLLGERFLFSGEASVRSNHYDTDTTYTVAESSLSAAYIFGTRTMLGGSIIERGIHGTTPFYFDRIDTQNEADFRGQTQLARGRYTVALLERLDLSGHQFFDTEIALGLRGSVIEPRFYYNRLNSSIGFTIAFPGLTTP
jgi:hypothetical protein